MEFRGYNMPISSVLFCFAPPLCVYLFQAVDEVPQSLVRELEGNDSMRAKFEALCRKAQNDICKRIEEVDGEAKVRWAGTGCRESERRKINVTYGICCSTKISIVALLNAAKRGRIFETVHTAILSTNAL